MMEEMKIQAPAVIFGACPPRLHILPDGRLHRVKNSRFSLSSLETTGSLKDTPTHMQNHSKLRVCLPPMSLGDAIRPMSLCVCVCCGKVSIWVLVLLRIRF